MSRMAGNLRSLRRHLREFADDARYRISRTAPGPALVRLSAAGFALAGLALAVPVEVLFSAKVLLLIGAAAGVGLFPRTRWVTITLLMTVGAWLYSTIGTVAAVSLWRTGMLASTLYLTHTSAALAAALPYDAATVPAMFARWAKRAAAVLAASVSAGLAGMGLARDLPQVHSLAGPIVGSAVAAGLAALLAWLMLRRD